MAETDLTPEEAAADDRLPRYNTGAYDPLTNEFGFDEDGHQVNQMRQARDAGVMGRLARRLAIFVQGLANTVAANVLLTAEDAENTRLDRIATAENVVKAAEEVTKAAEQAQKLAGTSTTNATPGTGARTFTTQAGKYFAVGTFLTIVSTAAPLTRWMAGQVTAYNATTGALTVNVEAIGATTSAAASWSIYLGGPRGAQGIQGIPGIATMPYLARSANTQLVAGDSASLIDATGTFTQTFAAPATLGANWYAFIKNAGTGQITIPASDGRTDWIMYPGEMRLFQCDGTTLRSEVLNPFNVTFTASATFILPPGYLRLGGLLWGGGGGACEQFSVETALLANSVPVTIGAGGAGMTGNVRATRGGGSFFGPAAAYGGDGGFAPSGGGGTGGGGGGVLSFASGGTGGFPAQSGGASFGGGTGVTGGPGQGSVYGGGGGAGGTSASGGATVYGGAGGSAGGGAAAVSKFGGNGGTRGNPGQTPGGGGGAGADGARGELRLWGVA